MGKEKWVWVSKTGNIVIHCDDVLEIASNL